MDKQACLCLMYVVLLLSPVTVLATEEEKQKQRKERAIVIPAVYVGAVVGPPVWAWLVATFGAAALVAAHVVRSSSYSHSCANNRGWCRSTCFSHEYPDHYHSAVCGGGYSCCRPGNL